MKQAVKDGHKIVSVESCDSIRKAYKIMKEKKILYIPVTDSSGDIVGILSERDLHRTMAMVGAEGRAEVEFDSSLLVKDLMSWPVRTVGDDSPIIDVATVMTKEKISAVIVIGRNNKYRGIITTDDLLAHLVFLLMQVTEDAKSEIDLLLIK